MPRCFSRLFQHSQVLLARIRVRHSDLISFRSFDWSQINLKRSLENAGDFFDYATGLVDVKSKLPTSRCFKGAVVKDHCISVRH